MEFEFLEYCLIRIVAVLRINNFSILWKIVSLDNVHIKEQQVFAVNLGINYKVLSHTRFSHMHTDPNEE